MKPDAPRRLAAPCALLLCLFLVLPASRALSCTLWSAAGEAAGGGTIITKNRDFSPTSYGRLALVRPENGMAYLGFFALVKGKETLVAGVNQAGLTVVSATAGSLPRAKREGRSTTKALVGKLLAAADTVDAALAHRDWLAGHVPTFYMLADGNKTAWVEVGLGGQVAVRQAMAGTLAHTNHYLAPELAGNNEKDGVSSTTRLARITALLSSQPRFSLADFERMSRDRSAGPDNSIFRTGGTPTATRTMATFLVRTLPGQPSLAVVTGYDDPLRPWSRRLTLDRGFFEQIAKGSSRTLAGGDGGTQ